MRIVEPPVYRLYRLLWWGLDQLFPPDCGGCGKRGSRWCFDCQEITVEVTPPICEICGRSLGYDRRCGRCELISPQFDALRSWAVFTGPIRKAVHALKYQRNIALGDTLARYLINFLVDIDWTIDIVIPVPLAREREKERGYNQAALLARPLALAFRYPYERGGLIRTRETPSQIDLSYQQRHQNVWGAFKARESIVRDGNVLLVDDVATSGATMNACAAALKESGAYKVFCITLARTP